MPKNKGLKEGGAVPPALKKKLILLAEKYETPAFLQGDPSRVLRRYASREDTEAAAFVAALLAFGRRDQFLQKIDAMLAEADKSGGPAKWLLGGEYEAMFGEESEGARSGKKFYRFYSFGDMATLFDALRGMLGQAGSLGAFFRQALFTAKNAAGRSGKPAPHLFDVVSSCFSSCPLVPRAGASANKRVNMFLRWMVRRNSPVDIGVWDWYSPADLIVPLDTHVLQEAIRLGLTPAGSKASRKTAFLLTAAFKEIWPDDPCRGDFALFGLGVDAGAGG